MFRGFCVEIPSRKGSPSPIDSLALSSLSLTRSLACCCHFPPLSRINLSSSPSDISKMPKQIPDLMGHPIVVLKSERLRFGPVKIDLGVSFHCLRRNLQTAFVPSPLYPSIRSPMERIPFQMCVVGAFTLHTHDSSL